MQPDHHVEDIRLFLTPDEVERLIVLVDKRTDKHPCDTRLKQLLSMQLKKHTDRKGGLNNG